MRIVAIFILYWLFVLGVARVLSANSRTESAHASDAVPFQIRVSEHVATVPLRLRIEARYDAAAVRGGLCIVVDGEEFHTSCWDEDGHGGYLHATEVLLEHGGAYLVQMRQVSGNGSRQSNVEQLLLQ